MIIGFIVVALLNLIIGTWAGAILFGLLFLFVGAAALLSKHNH